MAGAGRGPGTASADGVSARYPHTLDSKKRKNDIHFTRPGLDGFRRTVNTMADYDQRAQRAAWPRATTVDTGAIDQGLRAYMLQVYNYMGFALVLTGVVAWFTYRTPALFHAVTQTPLAYLVMFAPLGIVFYLSFRVHKLSVAAAQTWFWVFAGLFGLSISYIFAGYTQTSIARVFFITAAMFGGMSLYGYTTRTDLSRFGSFLI